MDGMKSDMMKPDDMAPMAEQPGMMETPEAPAQQKICVVPLGDDRYKVYTEAYEAPEAPTEAEAPPGEAMAEGEDVYEGKEDMLKAVMGMCEELATGPTAEEQMQEGFGGEQAY